MRITRAVHEASTRNPAGIAICAVFRDEAPYLAEWVEFHRLVGVEHFLLYDDCSADSSRQVLTPYERERLVSVRECPMSLASGGQGLAYDDGLARARGRFRWLAFIDIDEFLFSPEHDSLSSVLVEFEQFPGVLVNWQVYGSSGLAGRPGGLVIESFTRRAPTGWVRNRRVKSIVDPERALRSMGPHFFRYTAGDLAVTENQEPVGAVRNSPVKRRLNRVLARIPGVEVDPYAIRESSIQGVSVDHLRINHYAVRSRQEFVENEHDILAICDPWGIGSEMELRTADADALAHSSAELATLLTLSLSQLAKPAHTAHTSSSATTCFSLPS
jgi:hypothetical protein